MADDQRDDMQGLPKAVFRGCMIPLPDRHGDESSRNLRVEHLQHAEEVKKRKEENKDNPSPCENGENGEENGKNGEEEKKAE